MASKHKVLIAEDDLTLRSAYVQILTKEGFDVLEATNGKEALKHLSKVEPDIILLDILMPEMGGMDFLKTAKLSANNPKIKVIAFSNLSDQHKLEEMVKLGVSENLLKSSLSPKQLVDTIKQLLK